MNSRISEGILDNTSPEKIQALCIGRGPKKSKAGFPCIQETPPSGGGNSGEKHLLANSARPFLALENRCYTNTRRKRKITVAQTPMLRQRILISSQFMAFPPAQRIDRYVKRRPPSVMTSSTRATILLLKRFNNLVPLVLSSIISSSAISLAVTFPFAITKLSVSTR